LGEVGKLQKHPCGWERDPHPPVFVSLVFLRPKDQNSTAAPTQYLFRGYNTNSEPPIFLPRRSLTSGKTLFLHPLRSLPPYACYIHRNIPILIQPIPSYTLHFLHVLNYCYISNSFIYFIIFARRFLDDFVVIAGVFDFSDLFFFFFLFWTEF